MDRIGVSSDALLAGVGLRRGTLDDPDARIPTEQADALWSAAFRASGDERLAMRAVGQLRAGDYRTLTYLAAHCRTLGDGLRRVVQLFDLIDRRIRWTLDDRADPLSLRLGFEGLSDPLPRAPVEYTLGALISTLRATTRLDWQPLRVEVGFADPGGDAAAEHTRVLGPMRYEAPCTQLLVARRWWRAPVPSADGALADMLADLAARQIRELPGDDDLRTRLRRAIGEALVGGAPTLAQMARQLGISERTLQRRLREGSTTFRDELDATRKATAELLLEDPGLALSEASWLLGFSDPRAFTRAFRRWHQIPPSAWRARRPQG